MANHEHEPDEDGTDDKVHQTTQPENHTGINASQHLPENIPTGTVTFLFTDIEGSTPLWERFPQEMPASIATHHAILTRVAEEYKGYVVKTVGDSFEIAFSLPDQALKAAIEAQRGLQNAHWGIPGPLKVRMGIHAGQVELERINSGGIDYAPGQNLNRAARIMSAGHGGQILISMAVAELLRGRLPEGVTLLDLNEHFLKGLLQPEHIFQVVVPDLPAEFPPLKSEGARSHNLPIQMTSFIGREQECNDVRQLLDQSRLLTLSGVGGTGKTRLAQHVATQMLGQFEHGIWFVELARLTDPMLVLPAVASVFGFYEDKAGMRLEARLLNSLQDQHLLLILDNCEHLIGEVARLTDVILRSVPGVKILATSREALGLIGETIYLVPSLATPDPTHLPPLETLGEYDAVRLFAERAVTVQPAFALTKTNAAEVAQICQRLDGIPLAIELAAARVKVFSTDLICERLNQRFRLLTGGNRTALPRHQTLRAAIDWSYGLLSEAEKALFHRLSVFVGGWSLAAAEAVCACGEPGSDVIDLLALLVNKSLVEVERSKGEVHRYRMLETVRQFAGELLATGKPDLIDETSLIRNRYLDYFLLLSETFFYEGKRSGSFEQAEPLAVEISNFRASLNWAYGSDEPETIAKGLRLACNLLNFWVYFDLTAEGIDWTKKGLALLAPEDERLIPLLARACYCAADLSNRLDNNRNVCLFARESVKLYRRSDQLSGLVLALDILADCVGYLEPDHPLAVTEAEASSLRKEIKTIFIDRTDILGLYTVTKSKIYQAIADKEFSIATNLVDEYRSLFKGTFLEEDEHWFSGNIARAQGDSTRALYHYQKLLDYWRRKKNKGTVSYVSILIGDILLEGQEVDQAWVYYQDAMTLAKEIGAKWQFSYALRRLARISLLKGEYPQVGAYLGLGLTLAPEMDPEILVKNCLLPLLNAAIEIKPPIKVACLFGFVEKQVDLFWSSARARKQYEHVKATLLPQLDETVFNTSYQIGHTLTLDQVIGEARLLAEEVSQYTTKSQAAGPDLS